MALPIILNGGPGTPKVSPCLYTKIGAVDL